MSHDEAECAPNGGPCKMSATIDSLRKRTDSLEEQAGEEAAKHRRFETQLDRFDEQLSAFKTQQKETAALMKRVVEGLEVGSLHPAKPRDEARAGEVVVHETGDEVRRELPSLGDDYGEGEVTKTQSRDDLLVRSKKSEKVAARLAEKAAAERTYRLTVEEENAALRATLIEREKQAEAAEAERRRNSDRVREQAAAAEAREERIDDKRWTRAQKIGAGIVALVTAAGGGATVMKLLSGLFPNLFGG